MLYAARQLLIAQVTVGNLNTQIAAFNTVYTTTVPNILAVRDGWLVRPETAKLERPALLYLIGQPEPGGMKLVRVGRRDGLVPLTLEYVSRSVDSQRSIERRTVWDETAITLEALLVLLENLEGQTLGATTRSIALIGDPTFEIDELSPHDQPCRLLGRLRTVLTVYLG
jgi:hypothetical protein